ncbi:hypothetical protein B566_EDAN008171 [Ephemera danica]|nr:hypothetical protein B566_EDAN008171 [Ephemera danica]
MRPPRDDEAALSEEDMGTDDGPSSLWSISTSGTPTRSSLVLPSPVHSQAAEPPRLTESVDDEDSSAQNDQPVPSVKRFKRRNYSLYCGSEDD